MSSVFSKAFIFLLLFFGSIYMNASDTLKVKKVRFFIEPKAIFITPNPSHVSGSGVYDMESDIPSLPGGPSGYTKETYNWHNKNSINFGLSGGLSIRLGKYFNYEVSLAYYHYKLFTKGTITSHDSFGYNSNYTYTNSVALNMLGIGNGLSFHYKKFIATNSIILTSIIASKSTSIQKNNVNGANSSSTSYNEYSYLSNTGFYLMSEHKIGYSLCKRLEAYIGINVLYNSPFVYAFEYHGYFNQSGPSKNNIMPFTSIKINF